MQVEILKTSFGQVLETGVKEALEKLRIGVYSLHNVVLKNKNYWCQLDHLIILPNRLVVIEDKNTTCDKYAVYTNKDIFTTNGKKAVYDKSVVLQLNRNVEFIQRLTPKKLFPHMVIEPVACIKAGEVESNQSIVKVVSHDLLWGYLNGLEAELEGFNPHYVEENYRMVISHLAPFFETSSKYENHLVEAGLNTTKKMTIDNDLLWGIDLKYLYDFKKQNTRSFESLTKKQKQLYKEVSSVLHETLGIIPKGLITHISKNATADSYSISLFYTELYSTFKDNETLIPIAEEKQYLINSEYIVSHCSSKNIFLKEFLFQLKDSIVKKCGDTNKNLSKIEIETISKSIDIVSILRMI